MSQGRRANALSGEGATSLRGRRLIGRFDRRPSVGSVRRQPPDSATFRSAKARDAVIQPAASTPVGQRGRRNPRSAAAEASNSATCATNQASARRCGLSSL
jgi:hypothetical protein